MVCPNCNSPRPDAHSHCTVCGYDLSEHIAPLACSHCDSVRPGTHYFCTKCGTELSKESVVIDAARVAALRAEIALDKEAPAAAAEKTPTIENLMFPSAPQPSISLASKQNSKYIVPEPKKKNRWAEGTVVWVLLGFSVTFLSVLFIYNKFLGSKNEELSDATTQNVSQPKAVTPPSAETEISKTSVKEETVAPATNSNQQKVIPSKTALPTVLPEAVQLKVKERISKETIAKASNKSVLPVFKPVSEISLTDVQAANGKKLRYLYTTASGLVGFFDDGTYAVNFGGLFDKESIQKLYSLPATGTYQNTIYVGKGEKDWKVVDYNWKAIPK